jgi:serine/threonine-protein kinase RsbW
MCPTSAAGGPPVASRQFSADTIGELLRALKARAIDHPESPALIASWPRVSADQMPAACAELRRQGHDVREVSIARPGAKPRRGWSLGPPGDEAVVVREVAEPKAVPLARKAITEFAEREGATDTVRSAVALAVSEACTNVVLHAYADADTPGYLEVRACRADEAFVVKVSDDGGGMVPRIDGRGLGIGLPMIARLTEAFEIRSRRERPGLVLRMQFNLAGAPAGHR